MRATIAKWNSQTLRCTNSDISSEFSRWTKNSQRKKVRCNADEGLKKIKICFFRITKYLLTHPVLPSFSCDAFKACDIPVGVRILQQNSGIFVISKINVRNRSNDYVNVESPQPCFHNRNRLRVEILRQINLSSLVVTEAEAHRFSSCSSFIKQARVGDIESSHVGNESLIVQQRFQSALCNLWLVRSVLSRPEMSLKVIAIQSHAKRLNSPAWILENIPQNRMRNQAVVVSHADIRSPNVVLLRHRPDSVNQLVLI